MNRTPLLVMIAVLSVALLVCAMQWRHEAKEKRLAADRDRSTIADLQRRLSEESRREELAVLNDRIAELSHQVAMARSSATPSKTPGATTASGRPARSTEALPTPESVESVPGKDPAGETSCPPLHPPVEPVPLPGALRGSIASHAWTSVKGSPRLRVNLRLVNDSPIRHRVPVPMLTADNNRSVRNGPLSGSSGKSPEWIESKQTISLNYEFSAAKGTAYTLNFAGQSMPIPAG